LRSWDMSKNESLFGRGGITFRRGPSNFYTFEAERKYWEGIIRKALAH